MQSLPEELQGRILELAGQQARPAVTLVCKSWNRLVYSQPGLWQQVTVLSKDARQLGSAEDNWWRRKLALLQRVRGAVRAAQFEGPPIVVEAASAHALPDGMQLADLVGALDPAALTSLTFTQQTLLAPAVSAIARCTRLRALDLSVKPFPLREQDTALFQLLSSLQQLKLSALQLPATLLHDSVAASMRHLTSLSLESSAGLPPTQPLTALTGLQELSLCELVSGDDGLKLLPVAAFPGLKQMELMARKLQVNTAGGLLPRPKEHAAYQCEKSCVLQVHEGSLHHGDQLRLLCLDLERLDGNPHSWGMKLHGADLNSAAPLPAVLRALCLASGNLASVYLAACSVQSTAFGLGHMVSSTDKVVLQRLTASGGEQLGVALDAMLSSMPSLQDATVISCDLSQGLPNSLVQCSSLQSLACIDCQLTALPLGPYVQGM